MRHSTIALPVLVAALCASPVAGQNTLTAAERSEGWQLLFDGKTLDGWRPSDQPGSYRIANGQLTVKLLERDANGEPLVSWRVADGEIQFKGPSAYLYYVGPVLNHDFKNFELKLDVKTWPGSNSGVFIHTPWQEASTPAKGYEIQICNSCSDPRRTGGNYGIQDVKEAPAKDNEWFTMTIRVEGKRIVAKVNDKVTSDYTEEPNLTRPSWPGRVLTSGTIALQGHDPTSEIHFRNIKIKALP
jgi:hypothetical protein